MTKDSNQPRVTLRPPRPKHAAFILDLVNSPGWLKFIGERNVKTIEDAHTYLTMVKENQDVNYYVVELAGTGSPIGVITLLKRHHLEFPDLGFALLPAYEGNGYAFEAATLFLTDFFATDQDHKILAIVREENTKSIKLIKKLGFTFDGFTVLEGKQLQTYMKQSPLLNGQG